MELLRITISKDAYIARATWAHRLATYCPELVPLAAPLYPDRGPTDALRMALGVALRPFTREFQNTAGEWSKILAVRTRGVKGMDLRIHAQLRSKDNVEYQGTLGSIFGGWPAGAPFQRTWSEGTATLYPDLVRALGDLDGLVAMGQSVLFESDLRELCQGVLEQACMPLWRGVFVLLSDEAVARATGLQTCLEHLDNGTASLARLSIDNTPANRQALARELAEGFIEQLESLTARAGHTAPYLVRLQAEYAALAERIALAETLLGVEIPCLDAQADTEMALAAAAIREEEQ